MRSNNNWMCAADYTCILIRNVWTPFLLSVTHTHAIRKMVCQKRLESICGKNCPVRACGGAKSSLW